MNLARGFLLCAVACSGCAHLPDGQVSYYLAQTQVRFKVVRTIACDREDDLLSSSAVTPVVNHSADTSRRFQVSYAQLRNDVFADTDIKVDFYPDGRLQAVNAALTGRGEEVFKSLTSIASSLALGFHAFAKPKAAKVSPCKYISDVAGADNKSITLNYEGDIDPSSIDAAQDIAPDALSEAYASNLGAIGGVCAVVESIRRPNPPFDIGRKGDGVVFVARQPALVQLSVKTGDAGGRCTDVVWSGVLPVAQLGTEYEMPVNKAPVFGKQQFVLSLQESGAIASLQYVNTSGTPAALNVIDNALATARGQAQKETQAITDEINLMLAQQRLVKCRADPSTCQ